ncbi:MAG: ABC transporter permease [Magnetococcales bacterium]|nr:ABC transporter permease [Magnetococcales bacterium]
MSSSADPSLKVSCYSSKARLHHPVVLLRSILDSLLESRELAWQLFLRDIRQRYRQSVLGLAWVIVPSIVTTLVFVVLNERKILNISQTDIPYPLYVMIGTLLWQLFIESVTTPLRQFESCTSIMIKINMPREAPIVASFWQLLFFLGLQTLVACGVFFYFDLPLTWGVLWAIPVVLMLIFLGMAVGVLLIPLGALYKDVGESIGVLLRFVFFLTPVVYPPPTTWPFSALVSWNPVTPLLMGARDLITKGSVVELAPILITAVAIIVASAIVLVLFRISILIVLERLGA